MSHSELDHQIDELAKALEKVPSAKRQALRPQISRILDTLNRHDQPIPRQLRRMDERLDQEFDDDLFDNMPV